MHPGKSESAESQATLSASQRLTEHAKDAMQRGGAQSVLVTVDNRYQMECSMVSKRGHQEKDVAHISTVAVGHDFQGRGRGQERGGRARVGGEGRRQSKDMMIAWPDSLGDGVASTVAGVLEFTLYGISPKPTEVRCSRYVGVIIHACMDACLHSC